MPPLKTEGDSPATHPAGETPRILLEDIPAADSIPKPAVDEIATKEAKSMESAARREQIRSLAQDTRQRKIFAARIFWLLCAWVFSIFAVVLLQGFQLNMFRLSDTVLLALIGSSTVNIIGVFLVVVNYLFPKK